MQDIRAGRQAGQGSQGSNSSFFKSCLRAKGKGKDNGKGKARPDPDMMLNPVLERTRCGKCKCKCKCNGKLGACRDQCALAGELRMAVGICWCWC